MTFTEILERNGIPYLTEGHHHCTPGRVQIDCPSCSPNSGRWRLGFNLRSGSFHCWVCGRLNTVQTLQELTGKSYHECKRLLDDLSIPYTGGVWGSKVPRTNKLVTPPGLGVLLPCHKDYLCRRGFDIPDLVQTWGIAGLSEEAGRSLHWRIFIPIQLQGRVVSWSTRSISDQVKARYKNASPEQEEVSRRELLYGEDYCNHTIIVVEGFTDVWRIGPGAAATMSASFSRAQMLKIARYPVRVVCFDNDEAGNRASEKLVRQLEAFPGETYKVTLSGKDPDSTPVRELEELKKRFLS